MTGNYTSNKNATDTMFSTSEVQQKGNRSWKLTEQNVTAKL